MKCIKCGKDLIYEEALEEWICLNCSWDTVEFK
jgi:DNA-directed RNA polymerase subunit RPC12/RpoP